MGNELKCRALVEGLPDEGTALLETDELLFRGGKRRVAVRFSKTREAKVGGGWLTLGPLAIELGPKQAERWAQLIRSPKSVLEKLGVKAGQTAVLLGKLPGDFAAQLQGRGLKTSTHLPKQRPELVFLAVITQAQLKKLPAIADDGALWLIREKGKLAPISEHQSRSAGLAAGLVDVKVVSFSETHSAEKYVVPLQRRGIRR